MAIKRGFTCGAFDLLHAGHVLMLKEAKSVCDYLIVGLHVDPSTERKEKSSPCESVLERQIKLRGCKYVDEVIVYESEKDLETILFHFKIHIRIVSEEYKGKEFTAKHFPVEIYYNERRHNFSSAELRKRIYDNKPNTIKS